MTRLSPPQLTDHEAATLQALSLSPCLESLLPVEKSLLDRGLAELAEIPGSSGLVLRASLAGRMALLAYVTEACKPPRGWLSQTRPHAITHARNQLAGWRERIINTRAATMAEVMTAMAQELGALAGERIHLDRDRTLLIAAFLYEIDAAVAAKNTPIEERV